MGDWRRDRGRTATSADGNDTGLLDCAGLVPQVEHDLGVWKEVSQWQERKGERVHTGIKARSVRQRGAGLGAKVLEGTARVGAGSDATQRRDQGGITRGREKGDAQLEKEMWVQV